MCEMAQADGIDHIVATPHANDEFRYDREVLFGMLEELSRRVSGKLQLSLGCDFHLSYENLVDVLRNPLRYTISGTNYLLVELSDFSVPPSVSQSLHRLLAAGIVPIITHPERNLVLRSDSRRVLEWVEEGSLVQITANSLTGYWGPEAQQTAEWLMANGAAHFLATDAHGIGSRPPILSQGLLAAEKILGKRAAQALVRDNPRAVVGGESVPRTKVG
jgi:protein-tyrosine phosphatase